MAVKSRAVRGTEPERCLWQMKRWRRAVQRSKSEMRRHRVFGNRKREGIRNPKTFGSFGYKRTGNIAPMYCLSTLLDNSLNTKRTDDGSPVHKSWLYLPITYDMFHSPVS